MPLPLAVDDIATVPEAARGAYVQRDGKYHLDAAVEDVGGLKSALQKERDAAADAKRQLAAALAKTTELETAQKAAQGGITEQKLAEIKQQVEQAYAPKLTALEAATKELRALRLERPIDEVLSSLGAHDLAVARKVVSDHFDLTDDGKAFVKDAPTTGLTEWAKAELPKRYPYLFKGTQADGGNAQGAGSGSGAGGNGGGDRPVSDWSPEDRFAYAQAHGRDALLKRAAEDGRKKAAKAA
jgi:hypothetical protein